MKRLVTLVVALAVAGAAFAVDFSLGVRGNIDLGLGTKFNDDTQEALDHLKDMGVDISCPLTVGLGFGVYGHIGFCNFANLTLGATLEFGLNLFNGKSYETNGSQNGGYSASAVDIPIMITLKVPAGEKVKFDFGLGPNFSFPFGAGTSGGDFKDNYDKVSYKPNFGLVFDADVGFKVGHGYLIIDVRYLLDTSVTSATLKNFGGAPAVDMELFYRRVLNLGIGYEFNF